MGRELEGWPFSCQQHTKRLTVLYRPARLQRGSSMKIRRSYRLVGRLWRSCTQNILVPSRLRKQSDSSWIVNCPYVFFFFACHRSYFLTCLICNDDAGRFMATRSHRRCLQQELRHFVPKLQVLVHGVDVGQGS